MHAMNKHNLQKPIGALTGIKQWIENINLKFSLKIYLSSDCYSYLTNTE